MVVSALDVRPILGHRHIHLQLLNFANYCRLLVSMGHRAYLYF